MLFQNANAGAIFPNSHPRTPPNPAAPLAPDQRALQSEANVTIIQVNYVQNGARVAMQILKWHTSTGQIRLW
eukprot:1149818-Pelagomonas_calceolata.AAC.2